VRALVITVTRIAVRAPRVLLASWLAVIVALTIIGLPLEERLNPTRLILPGTPSAAWDDLRSGHFGDDSAVVVQGPRAVLDREGPQLARNLARSSGGPLVSPWSGASLARRLRPTPGTAVIIIDAAPGERTVDKTHLAALQRDVDRFVRPPLHAVVTGTAPLGQAINVESIEAAGAAEKLAMPILLLVLLLVFRSPLAAAIPLLIAGATVVAGRGVLVLLTGVTHLDAAAGVLLSMIGLALGVDYSLLIVTRFREALAAGDDTRHAAVLAAHTAGRTASFAGATLLAILGMTLLLAPGGVLVSAALGAVAGTVLSMFGAMVAAPALLVLAGHRIPPLQPARSGPLGRVVGFALDRPGRAMVLAATPLLVLALAALRVDTSSPDPRALPVSSAGGKAFAAISRVGFGPVLEVVFHSASGPVTEPARLRAEQRLERQLATLPSVRGVAGPGQLGTALATSTDRELAKVRRGLRRARDGLRTVRRGLTRAGSGAVRLADGGRRAGAGATRLVAGVGRAGTGARTLRSGLGQARGGAGQMSVGLAEARAGARALTNGATRLQEGSARAAAGADRLERGLRDLIPALTALGHGLASGASGLDALREPAGIASERAKVALRELQAMTVGQADPQYRRAILSVGTVVGTLTGLDPRSGAALRGDYRGLESELATARDTANQAANGARKLIESGRVAVRGATELRTATRAVTGGIRRLRRGLVDLQGGLAPLVTGAGQTGAGLSALSSGGGALAGGLDQIRARTSKLADGLERLQAGQTTLARRLRDAAAQLRTDPFAGQDPSAPASLRSGFAPLAALDSAGILRRAAGRYVLDLDGGGSSGRILVLTGLTPTDARTADVLKRAQAHTADFARRTGEQAAVGGLAAELVEFADGTNRRLPIIIAGIVLVSFAVLVVVLRSLLLPAIAVGLNLLTVAATFGVLTLLFVGDDPVLGGSGALDVISVSIAFAVVFALSIDYQVFLLARMREGFVLTQRAEGAIRYGIEHTGRIVTGAALIMLGVFAAFATADVTSIQQFGIGLGAAIVIDATLVRLVLLPAVLRVVGLRAWWFPDRMERRVPELDVEGVAYVRTRAEIATRAAELW
jgi:RND superfamily putative drug exporter